MGMERVQPGGAIAFDATFATGALNARVRDFTPWTKSVRNPDRVRRLLLIGRLTDSFDVEYTDAGGRSHLPGRPRSRASSAARQRPRAKTPAPSSEFPPSADRLWLAEMRRSAFAAAAAAAPLGLAAGCGGDDDEGAATTETVATTAETTTAETETTGTAQGDPEAGKAVFASADAAAVTRSRRPAPAAASARSSTG